MHTALFTIIFTCSCDSMVCVSDLLVQTSDLVVVIQWYVYKRNFEITFFYNFVFVFVFVFVFSVEVNVVQLRSAYCIVETSMFV